MSGRWWRAYNRSRHNAKLLRLSDKHFRWWFNLLCVAAENDGRLPDHADLCAEFRIGEKAMTEILDALVAARLFDHDETGIRPHDWNELQYKSDVSTSRVKRFRERHGNVTRNVSVTPSETDTDTEADTEQREVGASAPPQPTKRGARLPEDWEISEGLSAFATGLSLDPGATASAFKDYWRAASGANARKLDWDAAFRTWCRRQSDNGKSSPRVVAGESWNERRIRLGRELLAR